MYTKTSLMLGLGETEDEIVEVSDPMDLTGFDSVDAVDSVVVVDAVDLVDSVVAVDAVDPADSIDLVDSIDFLFFHF